MSEDESKTVLYNTVIPDKSTEVFGHAPTATPW